MVLLKARFVVGVCILSAGLFMCVGGGSIASAEPQGSDSTSDTASDAGHGNDANGDNGESSPVDSAPQSPNSATTVAQTTEGPLPSTIPSVWSRFGSGRTPGEGTSERAKRRKVLPASADPTDEKVVAGPVAVPVVTPSDVAASVANLTTRASKVITAIPGLVAPGTGAVASVPSLIAPVARPVAVHVLTPSDVAASIANLATPASKLITAIPGLVAPGTNAVASVPSLIAPVAEAVASVPGLPQPVRYIVIASPDLVAPVTDLIAMVPTLIASGSVAALALAEDVMVAAAVPLTQLQSHLLSYYTPPVARAVPNGSLGLLAGPTPAVNSGHALLQQSPAVVPAAPRVGPSGAGAGIAALMGYATPLAGDSPQLAAAPADASPTDWPGQVARIASGVIIVASLWALALAAFPGLGGLALSTSAGVRLGYRQAKAGAGLQMGNLARFARPGPTGIARPGPIGIVRSGSVVEIRGRALNDYRRIDRAA